MAFAQVFWICTLLSEGDFLHINGANCFTISTDILLLNVGWLRTIWF